MEVGMFALSLLVVGMLLIEAVARHFHRRHK